MSGAWETKRSLLRLDRLAQDGAFTGYASLFGKVDLGRDRVERGAFAKSLKARGATNVRMLYQHDPAAPVGAWTAIEEDAMGLRVNGRIAADTPKGAEVLALLRAGAVDGLSIGFRTVRARKLQAGRIRSILEADLWEISIVTFPMLPQARVEQVKAAPLPDVRAFERWLTRDAGLSRRQAKTIIAKGFTHLSGQRDAAPDDQAEQATAMRIRAAAARFDTSSSTTGRTT